MTPSLPYIFSSLVSFVNPCETAAIMSGESVADKNIAVWKVKKLIKSLELARGYVIPVSPSTWPAKKKTNFIKERNKYDLSYYSSQRSNSTCSKTPR